MKNFNFNSFFSQFRLKPVFFLVFFQLVFFVSNQAISQTIKAPLVYTNTPQVASCTNIPTNIELVNFNTGLTYFQGGGISILIKPTGVFEIDNQFILELSNSSGNFSSSEVLAVKNEFFIPALNGIIPATTTPGVAYKLRVRSTKPARELVTGSFSIGPGLAGSKSPSISFIEGYQATSLEQFIKCVNSDDYFFGFVDKSSNDLTPSGVPIRFDVSDFNDQSSTTTFTLIDESGNQEILSRAAGGSQATIPGGKPVGYYLILATKTYPNNSVVTTSFVFLYNTGSTGISNVSSENVCINESVFFSVDRISMEKNYPGSLYSVDHGDVSGGTKYYTHARFMACQGVQNTYTKPTCDDTANRDLNLGKFFFRTDLKLYNKGLFSGASFLCDDYLENGQGTTKWINVSKAPQARFDAPEKVCAGSPIFADENSIPGQYGDESLCLSSYNVSWEVKYPGDSDFTVLSSTNSWINQTTKDLTIPGSVTQNNKGCWVIKLIVSNPRGCTTPQIIEKTVAVEEQPIPSFTSAPSSPVCLGTKIAFTNTSNTVNTPFGCQTPPTSGSLPLLLELGQLEVDMPLQTTQLLLLLIHLSSSMNQGATMSA